MFTSFILYSLAVCFAPLSFLPSEFLCLHLSVIVSGLRNTDEEEKMGEWKRSENTGCNIHVCCSTSSIINSGLLLTEEKLLQQIKHQLPTV